MAVALGVASLSYGAAPAKLSLAVRGDTLLFDKAALTVKAGQSVSLTFTNKAPKTAGLQHNWVLVKQGAQEEVANLGIQAGPDKGYVPASDKILAHTRLLSSGESDTVVFTAPAQKGDYPFICTFPGHWMMMKGVLKVK